MLELLAIGSDIFEVGSTIFGVGSALLEILRHGRGCGYRRVTPSPVRQFNSCAEVEADRCLGGRVHHC